MCCGGPLVLRARNGFMQTHPTSSPDYTPLHIWHETPHSFPCCLHASGCTLCDGRAARGSQCRLQLELGPESSDVHNDVRHRMALSSRVLKWRIPYSLPTQEGLTLHLRSSLIVQRDFCFLGPTCLSEMKWVLWTIWFSCHPFIVVTQYAEDDMADLSDNTLKIDIRVARFCCLKVANVDSRCRLHDVDGLAGTCRVWMTFRSHSYTIFSSASAALVRSCRQRTRLGRGGTCLHCLLDNSKEDMTEIG